MIDLIEDAALVLPWFVAAGAGGVALMWWRRAHAEGDRAARAEGEAAGLTQVVRAAERALGEVRAGLAAPGALERPGEQPTTASDVPGLSATVLGQLVNGLAGDFDVCLRGVVGDMQVAATREAARVRGEALEAMRSTVRTVASALVSLGSELSGEVSAGVRRHQGDEAFETLTRIDHMVQQQLMVAQGYVVLSGGVLGRRWPATTLTDVARAAMGRVRDYQRVWHAPLDDKAVVSRSVEALVHTVAILMDNGLRYSPPQARVELHFQDGHHGVTVVIDDAGLQMNSEQLDRARRILSRTEADDLHALGAYPQTGMRVAALLGARYGFRVSIEAPNHFGGTRAAIFVPHDLLTRPLPDPVMEQAPSAEVQGDVSAGTTAGGLTVRRRRSPAHTPAVAPVPVHSGGARSAVVTAWADGTRRARAASVSPAPTKDSES
jgi:signal transduction histidine kinase